MLHAQLHAFGASDLDLFMRFEFKCYGALIRFMSHRLFKHSLGCWCSCVSDWMTPCESLRFVSLQRTVTLDPVNRPPEPRTIGPQLMFSISYNTRTVVYLN